MSGSGCATAAASEARKSSRVGRLALRRENTMRQIRRPRMKTDAGSGSAGMVEPKRYHHPHRRESHRHHGSTAHLTTCQLPRSPRQLTPRTLFEVRIPKPFRGCLIVHQREEIELRLLHNLNFDFPEMLKQFDSLRFILLKMESVIEGL